MKLHCVIAFAFVLHGLVAFGQTSNENTNVLAGLTLPKTPAVFIIDAGDRTLEIPRSATLANSFPPEVQSINPNLIESATVIKGNDEVDANGIHTRNFSVMIVLKEGSFDKLPADLAARFKPKQ